MSRCRSSCRRIVSRAYGPAQANNARKILEPGDLEEGLKAASSVGDDTLQKREQGTVVPDSFTHGTSAQRVGWFRRGFDAGENRQLRHLQRAVMSWFRAAAVSSVNGPP